MNLKPLQQGLVKCKCGGKMDLYFTEEVTGMHDGPGIRVAVRAELGSRRAEGVVVAGADKRRSGDRFEHEGEGQLRDVGG